jgi:hypothetical protein
MSDQWIISLLRVSEGVVWCGLCAPAVGTIWTNNQLTQTRRCGRVEKALFTLFAIRKRYFDLRLVHLLCIVRFISRLIWRSGRNTCLLRKRSRVRFQQSANICVHHHVCLYWAWVFLCIICIFFFPHLSHTKCGRYNMFFIML